MTSAGADVSGEAEVDPSGRGGVRTIEHEVSRQFDLQVSMEHLASLTGGRAFYNTNDVSAMLDQSVNEGGHYYRLTTPRRTSGGTERIATYSLLADGGYHLAYRRDTSRWRLGSRRRQTRTGWEGCCTKVRLS
jgi:hypothetical protein